MAPAFPASGYPPSHWLFARVKFLFTNFIENTEGGGEILRGRGRGEASHEKQKGMEGRRLLSETIQFTGATLTNFLQK